MRRLNHDGPIDCSLCKRLRPPVLITVGDKEYDEIVDGKRQKLDLSNGEDLLLPEQKYPPECIPCYEFFCGHCYHVQCLARLNPKKYKHITYRKDGIGDTLEIDEFHCLDCRGTQAINYTFNPNKKEGENEEETATGTIYINVPDAFQRAETDLATFLDRHHEIIQSDVTLNHFINEGTSRKEIEEYVLPKIQSSLIKYLTLEKPAIKYPLVHVRSTKEYALENRLTDKPLDMENVCLADLVDGVNVHWTEKDKDYFRKKH